jgi:hypothetical protein
VTLFAISLSLMLAVRLDLSDPLSVLFAPMWLLAGLTSVTGTLGALALSWKRSLAQRALRFARLGIRSGSIAAVAAGAVVSIAASKVLVEEGDHPFMTKYLSGLTMIAMTLIPATLSLLLQQMVSRRGT